MKIWSIDDTIGESWEKKQISEQRTKIGSENKKLVLRPFNVFSIWILRLDGAALVHSSALI